MSPKSNQKNVVLGVIERSAETLAAILTLVSATLIFVGVVLRKAIVGLCSVFNSFIKYYWVPIWCGSVRPAIYMLLMAIENMLNFFSFSAGQSIQTIWDGISGGDGGLDVAACIATASVKIDCGTDDASAPTNATAFMPAPIATRCWVSSATASGP